MGPTWSEAPACPRPVLPPLSLCGCVCSCVGSCRTLLPSHPVPPYARLAPVYQSIRSPHLSALYCTLFTVIPSTSPIWLSVPSGFLVVFGKPNRSSLTFTCTSVFLLLPRYADETPASAAWSTPEVHGTVARHDRAKQHTNSDFEQAGVLFRVVLTEAERGRLVANIVGHLRHARRDIQGECVFVRARM